MALSKAELACVYAALVLVDDDVAVTVSMSFSFGGTTTWPHNRPYYCHTRVCVCMETTCKLIPERFIFVSSKNRVKRSKPSWRQPMSMLNHTGQVCLPRPWKVAMSRTWLPTSDLELEPLDLLLPDQPLLLHPPPKRRKRRKRNRNPRNLTMTWAWDFSVKSTSIKIIRQHLNAFGISVQF